MGNHTITDDGAARNAANATHDDAPAMPRARLTVLLIEDSPLIRRSLTEAIDALNPWHVSECADTPDDAIALLSSRAFDAVIVDLQLRRGSGMEVLAWMQASGAARAAFVAVLTNHALSTYRERCRQVGVTRFFDKSLEFDRVLDALHEFAQARAGASPG